MISIVLYSVGLFGAKMTFLCQYYRGLSVPSLRPIFLGATVLVGLWGISQVCLGIFGCNPISAAWDSTIKGTCISLETGFYVTSAGNIVTDIIILLIPIFVLSRLRLVLAQKLVLIGIFSLGFFTVAISVLRLAYLRLRADPTWENVPGVCWTIGELCSGIVCACLPTLRPLVSGYFPALSADDGRYRNADNVEAGPGAAGFDDRRGKETLTSTDSSNREFAEEWEAKRDEASSSEKAQREIRT